MTLLETIQKIVYDTIRGLQLTDAVFGTVTSASPLEVSMDVTQAVLRSEVLIVCDSVSGLMAGDKVLMLSVMHGQKFIVLSRVL